MNLLYSMRNEFNQQLHMSKNELRKWMLLNGQDTIEKFKLFEKNNFKGVLSFSGRFISIQLFYYFF
jgi:hypothetical protein